MKQVLYLIGLLTLCACSSLWSQVHLNESCVWKTKDLAFSDFAYINTDYSDFINGDTLIANELFYKVKREGTSIWGWTPTDTMLIQEINEYKGAIREENRIWYWIEKDSIESTILYDFNLVKGDSIDHRFGKFKLVLSDSIFHNNQYKKVYELDGLGVFQLIEGVGWNSGLLDPIFNFESISYLQCFHKDDESLTPDLSEFESQFNLIVEEIQDCAITPNRVIEQSFFLEVKIFPNPFTESFVFETESQVTDIQISNIIGEPIESFSWDEHNNEINLTEQPEGLYYLALYSGNIMTSHKLIKINH